MYQSPGTFLVQKPTIPLSVQSFYAYLLFPWSIDTLFYEETRIGYLFQKLYNRTFLAPIIIPRSKSFKFFALPRRGKLQCKLALLIMGMILSISALYFTSAHDTELKFKWGVFVIFSPLRVYWFCKWEWCFHLIERSQTTRRYNSDITLADP